MRKLIQALLDRLGARLPLEFRVMHQQFLLRVVDLEALSIEADIPSFLGQFAGILMMLSFVHGLGVLFFPPPPSLTVQYEQARLSDMLIRVRSRIVARKLDRVSPLAVPALLEISREMVARGEVEEEILRDHEDALIADAMRVD